MKKSILAAAIVALFALTGCNTMEGLGQDIKKGAGAVGHAIGKAGDKLSETAQSMSGEPGAAEKKDASSSSETKAVE